MKYIRDDLAKYFAKQAGISTEDARKITGHFLGSLKHFLVGLKCDDTLSIKGLGVFKMSLYRGRVTVRNPKTKEPAVMSARRRLRFIPSKLMKEKLKKVI